jgi:hypothetical protein
MLKQQIGLFEVLPPSLPRYVGLAELEEEFRRHNPRFRREMSRLARQPSHPLGFWIKKLGGKLRFRTGSGLRVDAGHVIPVQELKRRGWQRERLMLQLSSLNRSEGAQMGASGRSQRIEGRDVDGVPVELQTLRILAQTYPHLKKYINRRYTTTGWTAPSPEGELHFFLDKDGSILYLTG